MRAAGMWLVNTLVGFAAGALSCYMLLGTSSERPGTAGFTAGVDASAKEQHLIKENQQLRRVLALSDYKIKELLQMPPQQRSAELQGAGVLPSPQGDGTATQPARTPASGKYWLNAGGIRHNDSCRYYRNGRGEHLNDQSKGRACRICGG